MANKTKASSKSKAAAASSKSKPKAKPVANKAARQRAKPAAAATKASKGSPKAAKPAKPAAKSPAKGKAAAAAAAKKKPAAKLDKIQMKPAAAAKKPAATKKPAAAKKPVAPAKPAAKLGAASSKPKAATPARLGTAPKQQPEKPAAKAAPIAVEPRKEEKKPVFKPAFKAKEFVVYPSHGVGQIIEVVEQEVAGHKLELFVINFDKEKMTLRVPTNKAQTVGMRKLSDTTVVTSALETLRGRARIKRTMWSRRAQEYEAKINSGDLISIAEVVRDLYRSERQPEQSYSERQLYEAALDRMAREVAAVERIGEDVAIQRVEAALQGGAGRGEKVASEEIKPEEGDEEEAAA